jgi:hypothetical protein
MKAFYEVAGWDSANGGGAAAANTVEEAAATCGDPRCYVVAIENGWERRQLNEEEELQLAPARRQPARQQSFEGEQ